MLLLLKRKKGDGWKEEGRETIIVQVKTLYDTDLSEVSWFDNKALNVLSAYVGAKPEG
jgi:hypothetical protein